MAKKQTQKKDAPENTTQEVSPHPGGPCPVVGEFAPRRAACKNCSEERNKEYFEACKNKAAEAASSGKKSNGNGVKRGHTSPKYLFILNKVSESKWTRKEIMAAWLAEFPDASKTTVGTYLSDGKNPTYNQFPRLILQHTASKVLYFEGDKCLNTEAPAAPVKEKAVEKKLEKKADKK